MTTSRLPLSDQWPVPTKRESRVTQNLLDLLAQRGWKTLSSRHYPGRCYSHTKSKWSGCICGSSALILQIFKIPLFIHFFASYNYYKFEKLKKFTICYPTVFRNIWFTNQHTPKEMNTGLCTANENSCCLSSLQLLMAACENESVEQIFVKLKSNSRTQAIPNGGVASRASPAE